MSHSKSDYSIRLWNIYNLLHANIDPQQLKFAEVFLDGDIPLFPEDQSLTQPVSLARIKHVEQEVALRDLATIETFREYIAGLLDPKVVETADALSDISTPGWNERTGEIRAVLPNSPGEMFLGGS